MASYGQAAHQAAHHRPASYGIAPMAMAVPAAPAGTFAPGTKIQVGNHRVVIQKYLSEGGFAHVYLVKLPAPVNGTDQAVLKRVAVPDKESLRGMRTEVETMKRLKGHRAIVTYIDSHASELHGGGYEVFLLMEYCNGGGLIDFMNTRLQHRLTEPEILHIFADVAEGVACMHYLRPPLLHRDLKVENVLITVVGSARKFKLCDFGSAAPPRPAPTTAIECRQMDEDVQRHTTMQYRSPEMVDVYRKLPIDEKSDIWALGVLLYKLCYYTTPFEDQGQLAILNASYKFPSYPVFSDRLKGLIAWMLRENPQARPNIYQVLRETCSMQGREPPIKDIYSGRSSADPSRHDKPLPNPQVQSPPMVGAVFSPQVAPQQQAIPEVERMRRGRVPAASPQPNRPSPSPSKVTNGDPFAALDSRPVLQGGDELSARFPTLDQFSLLHDKGQKFDFDTGSSQPQSKDLSQRVVERLADEAFQIKPTPAPIPPQAGQRQLAEANRQSLYQATNSEAAPMPNPAPAPAKQSRASAIISSSPELQAISSQTSQPLYKPSPKPLMVSTGTMTSPSLDQPPQFQPSRFPPAERHRASSVPRSPVAGQDSSMHGDGTVTARTGSRTPSFQAVAPQQPHVRYPSSSRPSLEGGRPSLEQLDPTKPKSRLAASSRPRPVSTHLESNLDFLREQESRSRSPALPSPRHSMERRSLERNSLPSSPDEETKIESNVEFLRSMEEGEPKKKDRSSKHLKRGSLTSLGAGTKSILAGKFGDAFKRFETNSSAPQPTRTPSPLKDSDGSEPTGGDGLGIQNWEDMTPEMRREHEARLLAQEEARVAAAQAEYRQRVGTAGPGSTPLPKSIGGVSRAVSIQNKVQSLLEESNRSSANFTRTAQGYGHYSDAAAAASNPAPALGPGPRPPTNDGRPSVPTKKLVGGVGGAGQITGGVGHQHQRPPTSAGGGGSSGGIEQPSGGGAGRPTTSSSSTAAAAGQRPTAPPKPTHLATNLTSGSSSSHHHHHHLPPTGATGGRPASPPKPLTLPKVRTGAGGAGTGTGEALLAVDLPGGQGAALLSMTGQERDDYVRDFQKRFPSLASIEMVERDIGELELGGGVESGNGGRGGR